MEYNTEIIMYDGTIEKIQNLKLGDQLMGADSNPIVITNITAGLGEMYRITDERENSYITNGNHMLHLKFSLNKGVHYYERYSRFCIRWFDNAQIKILTKYISHDEKNIDEKRKETYKFLNETIHNKYFAILTKDYFNFPKYAIKRFLGYLATFDFTEKEIDFDPYILGLWLGDGTYDRPVITSQDSTILHYLSHNLSKYNCYLRHSSCYNYRINGDSGKTGVKGGNNFINFLRKHNLYGKKDKHIPNIYKCNSRENRLKLLAGLIDSDGYLQKNKIIYEFTQVGHERLMDDTVYLCKSLGFSCYKKKKAPPSFKKRHTPEQYMTYMYISGKGIEQIPTLCPRKKAIPMETKSGKTLKLKIAVENIGIGAYYEIETEEGSKIVLSNFIVTGTVKK